MGFYGNITNTSNTTFSFDRIYPNRLAMDANVNNDGIFIGRYVLVEYQEEAAYPVAYHATETSEGSGQYYFYSSTNQEEISKIKYLGLPPGEPDHLPSVDDVNAIYQDGFYKGEILQRYIYSSDKKDWIFSEEFYACVGEDDKHFAIFELIADPSMKSHYIQNFEIDEKHYGQESKGFKGYDSTVWMKSSVTASDGKLITKYVNIADLNSVVPTFDIAADAPTMNPITPHFDADSTNVYYKLHMQSPYGFRVAKKPEGGTSDADTVWYETTYDKTQDKTETKKVYEGPADIYYNEAGFSPDTPSVVSNTAEDNYIKLEPTASSGATYSHGAGANDIQEFRLHLPAIGNMMSKAWDIIHGPDRDDYKGQWKGEDDSTDYSSLQGRLNALSDLQVDEIPVKRLRDGQIIGSKINGGKSEQEIYGSLDDAWIQTLVDGNTNTISIHHTFNSNKNGNSYSDIRNKEMPGNDTDNNINLNDGTDTLDINTPIIDATGHVVGKNIETVTLPYGYKTIKVTNTGDDAISDAAQVINPDGQIADNTQDELTLSASNRWVKLDNNTEDTIKIGHQVNIIEEKDKDLTDLNDGTDTITIQDTIYDEAGHVTANQKHTYTLPYGYKVIKTLNSEGVGQADIDLGINYKIVANKTQDEVQFEAANKWIGVMATEEGNVDKIYLGHLINGNGFGKTYYAKDSDLSNDDVYKQIPNFGDNVKILNVTVDNAGHVTGFNANTITIPDGSYTPANEATQHTDIITSIGFTPSSGAIISTKATTDTLTLSNYSANSGNLSILYTDTINKGFEKIQNHINSLDMNSTSTTEFITKITQTDGQVAVERAAAGTLQLGTASTDGTIPATSSLNNAFNITNNRIKVEEDALAKEVQDRKDAITKEVNDRNTAISSAISAIVDKDDDGTINKLAEVIEWINNNPSTATQMQKAIQDNTKAISDEAVLARSEEEKIAAALTTETGRATAAEQANTTAIGNEKTRAEGVETGLQEQIDALGTAAQKDTEYFATATQGATADTVAATIATYGNVVTHNHSEYATAAQGELADTAIQLDTEIVYDKIQEDDGEGNIIEKELKTTIETMAKEIANLKQVLKDNGLITE